MSITRSAILLIFLFILCACSDEDKGCPGKFNAKERAYFDYSYGQQLNFRSKLCKDTLVLTITERRLDEGPYGSYPEEHSGHCYSILSVHGLVTIPNHDTLTYLNLNGILNYHIYRNTRDKDKAEIDINTNLDDHYTCTAPNYIGNMVIGGRHYSSVLQTIIYPKDIKYIEYVYYSNEKGFLRIDYYNKLASQLISYELM